MIVMIDLCVLRVQHLGVAGLTDALVFDSQIKTRTLTEKHRFMYVMLSPVWPLHRRRHPLLCVAFVWAAQAGWAGHIGFGVTNLRS